MEAVEFKIWRVSENDHHVVNGTEFEAPKQRLLDFL